MAKGSEKSYQRILKTVKAKLHSFEYKEALEFIARQKNDWLPNEVTIVPNQREEGETKRFLICFDYLNMNECKLDPCTSPKAEALVKKFKIITDCEIRNKQSIIRDSVERVGEYESLFNKLTPDVQKLHEVEFASEGRIFFFHTEEKFNVVSIETIHRNIYR